MAGVAGGDGGRILEDLEQAVQRGTALQSCHAPHGRGPAVRTVVLIRDSAPV
jgi:hypothetical protein